MKNLTLAFLVGMVAGFVFTPGVARAQNDLWIGTITATGYDAGANAWHNLTQPDAGFCIPYATKLSIQPSDHEYICVDSQSQAGQNGQVTCGPSNGVLVPAGAFWQVDCNPSAKPVKTTQIQTDGGPLVVYLQCCDVAIVALDGGSPVSAKVFRRVSVP